MISGRTMVMAFGDLTNLGMAFPSLIGVYFLSGKLKSMLEDYWTSYKAGEFRVYDT